MTPEERAEKILDVMETRICDLKEEIAAQIREAVEEAVGAKIREGWNDAVRGDIRRRAMAEAYEHAARILAEIHKSCRECPQWGDLGGCCSFDAIEQIRARKDEVGK